MKILDAARQRQQSAGWVLLPLRLYLGVTFAYAGLSKILDRDYLDATAAGGVKQQMLAVVDTSPVSALLTVSAQNSTVTGLAIALGEVAVGVAVLVGLFTRAAAIGGLLLALSLFLTVTWTVSPYYLGADISLVFAWTPLIIAGDGGVLSLTHRLRAAVRRRIGSDTDAQRRTVVIGGSIAAALAAIGATAGSALALARRPSRPGSAAQAGRPIAKAADIAVGGVLRFVTADGVPAYLLRPAQDSFLAYHASCTHQGCEVTAVDGGFRCPCHNGTYDREGQVTGGPPPAPLARIPVQLVDGVVVPA
jgi:thiosulfate dehydrogenase [quinone] large subunit